MARTTIAKPDLAREAIPAEGESRSLNVWGNDIEITDLQAHGSLPFAPDARHPPADRC